MKTIIYWVLLSTLLWAQPAGRKPIEEFYEGLSMATELKFAEGMTSHRTADYQGVDVDGRSSDKWSDLYRFRDLFTRSLSVKVHHKILTFSQQGSKAVCTLQQDWEITEKLGKAPQTRVVLESRVLEDTWVWQDDWKLSRSVIKSRSLPSVGPTGAS